MNRSLPIRSILKNNRLTKTDDILENKSDDQILKFEEKEKHPQKKTITTITEEFHHIHRKIIEQYEDGILSLIIISLSFLNQIFHFSFSRRNY